MKTQLVKLHTAGSRWHVSYYSTSEGKRQRKRIYGEEIRTEKDLEKKMQALLALQARVFDALKCGEEYAPGVIVKSTNIYRLIETIQAEKSQWLKSNAYRSLEKNIRPFKEYLLLKGLSGKQPSEITRSHVLDFRSWLLEERGIKNRTANNYLDEVRTLFNYLIKNKEGLLYKNPCQNIADLPSRSEVHVAYTDEEARKLGAYMREKDPYLLFFVKFVAYVFMRPSEIRLLQVKHLDLNNRQIILTASSNKVSRRTAKLIPDIFMPDFLSRHFEQFPKNHYIFGLDGKPAAKPVYENYFTKRFRPVKRAFGMSELHTIYGFRHTFVSQLIRSGERWDEIMKLTGHTTMSSFEKYARSIMALPAKDLSNGFTVEL